VTDLLGATLAEQAAAVRGRRVSAVELTRAYQARIDAHDGALGAYLARADEPALAAAAAVDAAVARGVDPGPLAGVPLALKDMLVTRGVATTAGSKMLAGWVPPYDGTAVTRLAAAGAVMLGKLNCDEFGMGSSTENSALRVTHNPWDLGRVPGGSSGGSAAAVAAGLCAASLGTDTGGSVRQPAAFCGVVGLKPTYGRVSRHGVVAFASSLDQVGPIARSVADAALLLEVIAGADPLDGTCVDAPAPRLGPAWGAPVAGQRVGLPREYLDGDLAPEVRDAVHRAADILRAAGATIVDVTLPHTRHALPAYYLLAPAEAASNLARYDGVRFGHRAEGAASLAELHARSRGEGFGPEVKRRIMLGTYVLRAGTYDAYYQRAQRVRARIAADFDAAFTAVDVLLTPVTPTPAFALGAALTPLELYLGDVFTLGASLAGVPALAVPCGATAAGLPLGVQLIGRALDEASVLRAGAAIERALPTFTFPPAFGAGAP
jgi:aspartyl-tRNA(Asn)/glutamyl-tRNA(Gln) amidotransferase subunit A